MSTINFYWWSTVDRPIVRVLESVDKKKKCQEILTQLKIHPGIQDHFHHQACLANSCIVLDQRHFAHRDKRSPQPAYFLRLNVLQVPSWNHFVLLHCHIAVGKVSIQPFGKECNRKNQNTVSSNDRFKSCTFVLLWFSTLPVFSLVWRFSGGSPHVFLRPDTPWIMEYQYFLFLAILCPSNPCLPRPDTPWIAEYRFSPWSSDSTLV